MALATCRYERSPTIFIFGLVCIDLGLLAEVPHDFTVALVNCRFERSEAIFIVWPICTDLALFAKVAHDFDAAVAGCRYERNPTRMIFEVLRNIGVALTSCRLERSPGNLALVLFESILACSQRYRTTSRCPWPTAEWMGVLRPLASGMPGSTLASSQRRRTQSGCPLQAAVERQQLGFLENSIPT